LHDFCCWSSEVPDELQRLSEEFRRLGLCTWCGDNLGRENSHASGGLHAHCLLANAEPEVVRLARLRLLNALLRSEAG
jgi:hypothetical protein